jgi:hypothetical protein
MKHETDDIQLAADLVCAFLSEQGKAVSDSKTKVTLSLNKGVVAFARRVNIAADPTLFVRPIVPLDDAAVKEAIMLPRDAGASGHWTQLKVHPNEEWGFSPSEIDAKRRKSAKTVGAKLVNGGVKQLSDKERNTLDIKCFSSRWIVRVPVSFLGSPLLVCYFDCAADSKTKIESLPIKQQIYHRVVSPLSSLLATHTVLQLSQAAREIIFRDIPNLEAAQLELVKWAASLLLAKSATFHERVVVSECDLLAPVTPGISLVSSQTDDGKKLWEITLPCFKTFTGDAIGSSNEIAGVKALQDRIQRHVQDLMELLQRAAQWQKQVGAIATTRIVENIEEDLQQLLRHTEAARRSALKVEMVLTPSREDFLNHYDEVRGLFEEKQKRWYGVSKKNGKVVKCSGVHIKEIDCKDRGYSKVLPLHTVHSTTNVSGEIWNKHYKTFLEHYGCSENIELFRQFATSVTLQNKDDDKARVLFTALKLMLQKPHASHKRLFGLQLALSCATAWHGEQSKAVSYQDKSNKTYEFLEKKSGATMNIQLKRLLEMNSSLSDDDNKAFQLAAQGDCAQLLGSIMRLIKYELIRSGNRNSVQAQKVIVREDVGWLEIAIECHGCFDDPEKQLSVSDRASLRGLRALVENFCRATGQRQPHFQDSIEHTLLHSARKHFVIGSDPKQEKTVWLMSFAASEKQKPTSEETPKPDAITD